MRMPESYEQLIRDFPIGEPPNREPLTDAQLDRRRIILEPLPLTLINAVINGALSRQRRELPLSVGLVVELLDEIEGNKQNRERRARLLALQESGNIRSHSAARIQRGLDETPICYVIDEQAIARAMADDSITFRRDCNGITIEWETEEIILDDNGEHQQNLGRFKVKTTIGSHIVSADAIDPNPCSENDTVTHPHVRDGKMCLGDFILPIIRAGKMGRIGMLRRTVDSILNTYNPESPYMLLSKWELIPCTYCGQFNTGEHSQCVQCNRAGCRRCLRWSNNFNRSVCENCSIMCSTCEDYFPSNERANCNCPFCTRVHCSRCVGPATEATAVAVTPETLAEHARSIQQTRYEPLPEFMARLDVRANAAPHQTPPTATTALRAVIDDVMDDDDDDDDDDFDDNEL